MEKRTKKYQLTPREVDILYVMWKAGKPLVASEIAGEELALATVHTTLKRMMKKNVVEVEGFAKSGDVFARCYQPTVSLMEFELAAFSDAYKSMTCRDITVTDLMKAYLDGLEGDTLLEELDGLERFIKEKRKENGMGKRID